MSVLRDANTRLPRGSLMTRGWRTDSWSRHRLSCRHARYFGPLVRKTLCTSAEDIGFAVHCGNQPVDTFVFEDRPEFGATGRHLADRAVKVDIGDQPSIAVAPHQIIDIDWLTIRFDDLALHHEPSSSWLFSGDL